MSLVRPFTVKQTDVAKRIIDVRVAEEPISAYKLVTASSGNQVRLAQNNTTFNDAQVFGLSLNGANIGENVQVLLLGAAENAIFSSFVVNGKIYLGVNGSLTQTPPISGFQTDIGEYIGDNKVFIFRRQPIIL